MSEHAPISNATFADGIQREQLLGSRCDTCHQVYAPAIDWCGTCHRKIAACLALRGEGKLVAFTSTFIGPPWMNAAGFGREEPYCCGVIELLDGPRVVGRVAGVDAARPEQIKLGMPVGIDWAASGEADPEQLVFRPLSPC